MSASNYDEALKRVLVHEGGYSNDAADPGGPTNFGITIADYRRYINPAGTAADVRAMTVEQAKKIYRDRYAAPLRFEDLPGGVDYAVFDYGVNSGVSRAAKVLQRLVGVTVDGEIGDQTVAYARARDPKVLVGAICDERLKFLQGLSTWGTFGRGWGRRVSEVRSAAIVMAGATQAVQPNIDVAASAAGDPPWFLRQTALMGLYEFPGGADNPAILAMAKACGGNIARDYVHDAIPWCALDQNYSLISAGFPGTGSLLALDFRRYGVRLTGPAVGAIATKTRQGGGHVFQVVGRDKSGALIGRGGNQSDMVCDELFDPAVLQYNWPANYPMPRVGFSSLPLVTPAPKVHRDFSQLPPVTQPSPGKGVVGKPKAVGPVVTGTGAGAIAGGASFWHWIAAHPYEASALGLAGATVVIGGGVYLVNRYHAHRQDAPTAGVVPVAA